MSPEKVTLPLADGGTITLVGLAGGGVQKEGCDGGTIRAVKYLPGSRTLWFPRTDVAGAGVDLAPPLSEALAAFLNGHSVSHNLPHPPSTTPLPASPRGRASPEPPASPLSPAGGRKAGDGGFREKSGGGAKVGVGDVVLVKDQWYRVVKEMSCWNRYELEAGGGHRVWRDGKALEPAPRVSLGWDPRMVAHGESEGPAPDILTLPERPDRCRCLWEHLEAEGIVEQCARVEGRVADKDEILAFHTPAHFERVMARDPAAVDDPTNAATTPLTEGTPIAARVAVGCVIDVTTRVLATGRPGVAIVRPPGHHAERDRGMGFCLFNNVALAAMAALRANAGVSRVLVLDWDIHHGNGIQQAFYGNPAVLYISLHVRAGGNFYPGTGMLSEVGDGKGAGFNVNIPWREPGVGDKEYQLAFDAVVLPVARGFNPDLVLVSAGFDAAAGDPLGMCNVSADGFARMARQLLGLARGRVVFALEGGYSIDALCACASAVLLAVLAHLPAGGGGAGGDEPPALSSRAASFSSTLNSTTAPGGGGGGGSPRSPVSPAGSGGPPAGDAYAGMPASSPAVLVDVCRVLLPYWPCLEASIPGLEELEKRLKRDEDVALLVARRQMFDG
ncbi:Histone deacetylase 5 [Diplonema papillatum]|nr:Histone deacetylase 5 [Diplonema papillatum]